MNNKPNPMCEAYKAFSVKLRQHGVMDGAFIDAQGRISAIPMVIVVPMKAANDE